jgi:hypothetical protein
MHAGLLMCQGHLATCCFAQVDAVNSSHSHSLSLVQVTAAQQMLGVYLDRFRARLSPHNAQQVQLLAKVLQQLAAAMGATQHQAAAVAIGQGTAGLAASGTQGGVQGTAVSANDFLFSCRLDHVNFFSLLTWWVIN